MSQAFSFDRRQILRNASAVRSTWTPEARRRRAVAAERFTHVLSRMITLPESAPEECWAVGAPSDTDLGRLERAG